MRPRILALVGGAALVAAIAVAIVLLSGGSSESSLARAAGNLDHQSVHTQFRIAPVSGGGDSIAGSAVTSADGTKTRIQAHAAYEGKNFELTLVRIGSDVWVASNEYAGKLPSGKRWLHGRGVGSEPGMSVSEFADFLRSAADVSEKGKTEIRGRQVTEYAGTFSAKKLARQAGGARAKRVLANLGDRDMTVPIQAWLDDRDRPVRMNLTVDAGGAGPIKATIDVVAYGAPVDVQPPPAAETAETSELKGG
jgi:hypothetical protein